jgi:hypothetical protein
LGRSNTTYALSENTSDIAGDLPRRDGRRNSSSMLMEPSVLAVNFRLRNLELLLRQVEFLLAIVGFFSLLLERRAHEPGEPEQVKE